MTQCKYYGTTNCPFDDSDQGPPHIFTVHSCPNLKHGVYCPYYREMSAKTPEAAYLAQHLHYNPGKPYRRFKEKSLFGIINYTSEIKYDDPLAAYNKMQGINTKKRKRLGL